MIILACKELTKVFKPRLEVFLNEKLANINQTNVGWFSFFHNKEGRSSFFLNWVPYDVKHMNFEIFLKPYFCQFANFNNIQIINLFGFSYYSNIMHKGWV